MDYPIRLAAFQWLHEQIEYYQGTIPSGVLRNDFHFQGQKIPLIGARGIWKPRELELPISISTSFRSMYEDSRTEDGLLLYKYQGTDPHQWDNALLRQVALMNVPLIYFFAVGRGVYHAFCPVFVVSDDPEDLTFTVAIDDARTSLQTDYLAAEHETYVRRRYVTSTQFVRLHQSRFRYNVLQAYRRQCTLCRLKHPPLLDAAHIISDKEPDGQPIIQNGLLLCKIHHAAYDKLIIGIDPDYVVHVNVDVLKEEDGPMLKYGLQALNQQRLHLPIRKLDRPSRDRLDVRFQRFLRTG